MGQDKSGFDKLVENLSFLQDRITRRGAYLGVMAASGVFLVSLFFSWTQVRAGVSAADTGSRSGWAEAAYVAALPLLFVVYSVFKDRSLAVKPALVLGAAALVILMFNNVLNRTTWVGVQYMGLITQNAGRDMGSELGIGFWLGLLALVVISVCGISWAFHTSQADR